VIAQKVCPSLDLFNATASAEALLDLTKRQSYCTPIFQSIWSKCSLGSYVYNGGHIDTGKELSQCLTDNLNHSELIELREALHLYTKYERTLSHCDLTVSRENYVLAQVNFKERSYTSFKRDVSYTLPSLICNKMFISFELTLHILFRLANVGGLLGLCMGCSLVSIAEALIFAARTVWRKTRSRR